MAGGVSVVGVILETCLPGFAWACAAKDKVADSGTAAGTTGTTGTGGTSSGGVLGTIADSFTQAATTVLRAALSWWSNPGAEPTTATQAGAGWQPSALVTAMQGNLNQLVVLAAAVGIIVAAVQVAMTHRARPLLSAGTMLLTVMTVTGLAAIVTQLLLAYGDQFSQWVLTSPAVGATTASTTNILAFPDDLTAGFALSISMSGLVLFASLAQLVFMLFRAVVIPVLVVLLPLVAAMTATDTGKTWLKKLLGWLLAFVMYKPLAAIVYAMGLSLLASPPQQGEDSTATVIRIASALMLIVLAVLCLPALLKLVAPIAMISARSLFAGTSGLGGTISGAVPVGAGASLLSSMGVAALSRGGSGTAPSGRSTTPSGSALAPTATLDPDSAFGAQNAATGTDSAARQGAGTESQGTSSITDAPRRPTTAGVAAAPSRPPLADGLVPSVGGDDFDALLAADLVDDPDWIDFGSDDDVEAAYDDTEAPIPDTGAVGESAPHPDEEDLR